MRWLSSFLENRRIDFARVGFVATVVLAGAMFWMSPRLPMIDLAQHAGQVTLWRDLLLGTSKWQSFLYINYFTPYLVGYGLALPLSFVMPVSVALKLLLTIAYYGFVAACVALRSRLGGDRRLDWLFIPGFFGYAYALGFYTFLVAAPLAVLFILLTHWYADRPGWALGIALFFADLALFFSHGLLFLFANCIGGLFLFDKHPRIRRLLPAMLPYVAVGVVCVAYALVRLSMESNSGVDMHGVYGGWDFTRLNFLIFSVGWPVREVEADWALGPIVLLMLAAPLVLGARIGGRDATALIPFVVTLLVWVVVPDEALRTSSIYQRFALFLLPFYALLFRAPDRMTHRVLPRIWLPVLCWALIAFHAGRLLAFAKESAPFDEVLAATQPGYRALGVIFNPASASTGIAMAYFHFPLWYQAEKAGFVEPNFAGFLPQIVRYRPDRIPDLGRYEWPPRAASGFERTRDQASIYRYFFVRRTGPLPQGYFPSGRCEPVLLKSAGAWSVFENVHCHTVGER